MEDIIVGLATTLGQSSIAVIRVSGPGSIAYIDGFFSKSLLSKPSHSITYGHIEHNGRKYDEVLVSIFRTPKSYTTEDTVEINCHGGVASVKAIIELITNDGARLAEPGEFTKRAFLNGRIKLNEAEAVMDIIRAESDEAAKLALAAIEGSLTNKITEILKDFYSVMGRLEVEVDYPEYELEEEFKPLEILKQQQLRLEELLSLKKSSDHLLSGVKIAILGQPNVGKSSILNCILDQEKAIVSDIAGTTRDLVEGHLYLDGVKVNIIDTAGLRESTDVVEKIGVEKSLSTLEKADIILYVVTPEETLSTFDLKIIKTIKQPLILIVNKTDQSHKKLNLPIKKVYTSTLAKTGIEELKQSIKSVLQLDDKDLVNNNLYINNRQYNLLKSSSQELQSLIDNFVLDNTDLILIDLRSICENLNEIMGTIFYEELIDHIFDNFCLGK